jgi:hypothetical protein
MVLQLRRYVFFSFQFAGCWYLSHKSVAKEQSEVIKLIETNIDSCIKALIARKQALIQDVTAKFKDKRMFLIFLIKLMMVMMMI